MSPETDITNLLYRYAEYVDAGDLAGAMSLLEHAEIRITDGEGGIVDAATMRALMTKLVIIHSDGTPRTRHLITNPIVEVDGDTATCRSYYTVLQQIEGSPLQAIVSGRYFDRFDRVDGGWRFAYRDYTHMDLVGDVSRHLLG